jgi:hypothetical protein
MTLNNELDMIHKKEDVSCVKLLGGLRKTARIATQDNLSHVLDSNRKQVWLPIKKDFQE